jgi:hypothetical protein
MEKKDVPQDHGIFGQWHGVCYVTDENGNYVSSTTSGWEPTNIANGIAWEFINEDLDQILKRVKNGELSPLAYYMNKYMLDPKVLGRYVGLTRWRVKRHLKPNVFNNLSDEILQRYASIFNMTVEELKKTP